MKKITVFIRMMVYKIVVAYKLLLAVFKVRSGKLQLQPF